MDIKLICQDGGRFLFSSGISTATSVPISQCHTNQALSNKSDVKLAAGRGRLVGAGGEGTAMRGSHGSERLEWEMKIFAEFLRLKFENRCQNKK